MENVKKQAGIALGAALGGSAILARYNQVRYEQTGSVLAEESYFRWEWIHFWIGVAIFVAAFYGIKAVQL